MGGGDSRPHPDPSPQYESRDADGQEGGGTAGEHADARNPDGTTLPEFERGSEVGAGSGYGGGDAAGQDGASSPRERSEGREDGEPSAGRRSRDGFPLRLSSGDGPDKAARLFAARTTARLGRDAVHEAQDAEEEVEEDVKEVSEEIARASWRYVVGEDEKEEGEESSR